MSQTANSENAHEYKKRFREIEVIGRGNFGMAYLVQEIQSKKNYISKKIIMDSLKDKEQQSAYREAKLLKDLQHPNIVEFIESYFIDGILIIVMEYCEEGDLAFHIKRKKQKGEKFPEYLIINWFIQISFALNYIHEKKILHRDIKSSNIFLNSNGTVKLGDFGISKILDNTHDAAQTVVGTPYYLSPEVCESKPYTFKSDTWALGCVLYELCSLKHAFQSNNLLGLVYKIVKEKHDSIPDNYSQNMKNLISKLLEKDEKRRPTVKQVLDDNFIKNTITDFVKSEGKKVIQEPIPCKKTKTHNELQKMIQSQVTDKTLQSKYIMTNNQEGFNQTLPEQVEIDYENMTPQEKLKYNKLMKARQAEQQMVQATRQNIYDKNKFQNIKGNQFLTSNQQDIQKFQQEKQKIQKKDLQKFSNQQQYQQFQQYQQRQQQQQQQQQQYGYPQQQDLNNQMRNMSMNNQSEIKTEIYNQETNTYVSQNLSDVNNLQFNNNGNGNNTNLNNNMTLNTIQTEYTGITAQTKQSQPKYGISNNFNNLGNNQTNTLLSIQEDTNLYSDNFEDISGDEYDANNGRITKKASQKELNDVLDVYKSQLNSNNNNFNQQQQQNNNGRKLDDIQEESTDFTMSQKGIYQQVGNCQSENRIQQEKQRCIEKMGKQNFSKVYNCIREANEKGLAYDALKKRLIDIVGKEKLSDCFQVEQIVFNENQTFFKK